MFSHFTHAFRVVQHKIRAITKGRSPHWRACRKRFLQTNPTCATCGSAKNLDVHHIQPYHLVPLMELEENNLITLCMDKYECHFRIGHGRDYKSYNPLVREDAKSLMLAPGTRAKIEQGARDRRLYSDPLA